MEAFIHNFAVYVVPVVLAITLHEAAHAYVAKYFGDDTAYVLGRMTLNPIKHIDPVGTVLIPLLLFASGSPFIFGYAKPVPVNFGRLRKPKRDMAWVALAGPAANLIMGFMWLVLSVLLVKFGVRSPFLFQVTKAGVVINLVLFAFNLFPVLPLDGGRILASMLPNHLAYQFAKIERYGFFIVLGLFFLQVLQPYWMSPVMNVAYKFLQFLITPLTYL